VNSRSSLNWMVLVCAILILLISYYLGLVAIPLSMNTEVTLVIVTDVLAGFTLLGALERIRGTDEIPKYRPSRITSICAIAIIMTITLSLADVHPPGMDPEVPFLFVIPFLAFVIVLAVLIEEILVALDRVIKQRSDASHEHA